MAPPVTVHRFFSMQWIAFVGAPDVHQHARGAAHPRHVEGPVRAGDVRHRRGHEDDVGRSDRPGLGHRAHAIVEGVVVVEDALGTSRRPGRVHHHHRGSRVDRGKVVVARWSERQRVTPLHAGRPVAANDDDVLHRRQLRPESLEHPLMIVLAEHLRDEHQLRPAVLQDVAHLRLSIDRRDGVEHEPAPPRRERDDGSLDPVGQLERHDVAGCEATRQEEGREARRRVPRFGARHASIALDEEEPIGRLAVGAASDVGERLVAPVSGGAVGGRGVIGPARREAARIGSEGPAHPCSAPARRASDVVTRCPIGRKTTAIQRSRSRCGSAGTRSASDASASPSSCSSRRTA